MFMVNHKTMLFFIFFIFCFRVYFGCLTQTQNKTKPQCTKIKNMWKTIDRASAFLESLYRYMKFGDFARCHAEDWNVVIVTHGLFMRYSKYTQSNIQKKNAWHNKKKLTQQKTHTKKNKHIHTYTHARQNN